VREIAKARRGIHLTVRVKTGGKHRNAAFKVPVHRNPRRSGVPVIPKCVLERVAMPRALRKTARLVGNGVVRRIRKGSKRRIADVRAVAVDVVLGAGRAVLEVVFATMLRHPRAFDEGRERVAVVLSEAFPTVARGVEFDKSLIRAFVRETLIFIQFRAIERICVRRTPVHEPFVGVGVIKNRRIPWTNILRKLWQPAVVERQLAFFGFG
jgi:hypothetical protein